MTSTISPDLAATPVAGYRIAADTLGGVIDECGHPTVLVFLRHYG